MGLSISSRLLCKGPSHPWTPVRSAARQQDAAQSSDAQSLKIQNSSPLSSSAGLGCGGPQSLEVRYHGPKGAPPSDNLYVKGLQPAATEQDACVHPLTSADHWSNSLPSTPHKSIPNHACKGDVTSINLGWSRVNDD
eukprot:5537754-Amphidinium_carterae.1